MTCGSTRTQRKSRPRYVQQHRTRFLRVRVVCPSSAQYGGQLAAELTRHVVPTYLLAPPHLRPAPPCPAPVQLELIPAIGYVVVTRTVNVDGFSWAVTYSGCRPVGTDHTPVCNNGNVAELGMVSGLGAGTPTVTETLRGSGTAAYGSEVFTDLSSPQPYVHRVLGLPPSVLYYFRVSAQTVQGLGSRQLSTPRSIAASYQLPAAPDAPVSG